MSDLGDYRNLVNNFIQERCRPKITEEEKQEVLEQEDVLEQEHLKEEEKC